MKAPEGQEVPTSPARMPGNRGSPAAILPPSPNGATLPKLRFTAARRKLLAPAPHPSSAPPGEYIHPSSLIHEVTHFYLHHPPGPERRVPIDSMTETWYLSPVSIPQDNSSKGKINRKRI
jgi:hypothetical protein